MHFVVVACWVELVLTLAYLTILLLIRGRCWRWPVRLLHRRGRGWRRRSRDLGSPISTCGIKMDQHSYSSLSYLHLLAFGIVYDHAWSIWVPLRQPLSIYCKTLRTMSAICNIQLCHVYTIYWSRKWYSEHMGVFGVQNEGPTMSPTTKRIISCKHENSCGRAKSRT